MKFAQAIYDLFVRSILTRAIIAGLLVGTSCAIVIVSVIHRDPVIQTPPEWLLTLTIAVVSFFYGSSGNNGKKQDPPDRAGDPDGG